MNPLARILTDRSPNDIRRIARIYDASAGRWNRRQARGERLAIGRDFQRRMLRALDGDVLEVGCGTGELLRQLKDAPFPVGSYTGVDLSTGMLQEAAQWADNDPFPTTLHQMNAESMALFADDSFDTVTASLVLCTVPDPAQALREMARVCKPDGRIVLIEHVLALSKPVRALQRIGAPVQRRHMACSIDRPTDRLVRELGFRVEWDESRLFGVVHLIIMRPPEAAHR